MKFNVEEEERCPKTSPLALIGVLKAPVESEEGERRVKAIKKRKMVETELEHRDHAPTVVSNEGDNNEEKGGCYIQSIQCPPYCRSWDTSSD